MSEPSSIEPVQPERNFVPRAFLLRQWHTLRQWAKSYPSRLSVLGSAGALAAGLWSYTPSLLPRTGLTQGLVTGLSAITAYGLCNLVVWVVRGFDVAGWFDRPRIRNRIGWLMTFLVPIGWAVMIPLGVMWQRQQRDLLNMAPLSVSDTVALSLSAVFAMLFASAVLGLCRILRVWARRLGLLLRRILPPRMATVLAAVMVGVLVWAVTTNVLISGIRDGLDASFKAAAGLTDPGSQPPEHTERSGSAQSMVNWEDLGREGRRFVTRGPRIADIEAFSQARGDRGWHEDEIREPIRAYAGLTSDIQEAADLVVAELDRTDAWARESLLVVTATGSGWVDPGLADAFELINGGNTAIATMQYSYLPSWMAFLADRETPAQAGEVLFETIYERWNEIPATQRPKLYVAGLSLGSFGMQSAFSGIQDLRNRTDGALFAGTPYFVPLWQEITADRDGGSTQVAPVVEGGRYVRFYTGDSEELSGYWERPRTVFIQHGSDGTTWWNPSMLLAEPDWMNEPRADDVMEQVQWFPVTSFWQVAFDLFGAGGDSVPMGVGHQYKLEYVDGFASIVQPDGWTDQDTQLLRDVLWTNSYEQ